MDDRSAVDLLHRMLTVASPSGDEHDLADFLAGEMPRYGLRSRIDEVGNVIGETGTGDGPTVALIGHLDTVDDPLPVRRTGTRLYGRGAVDAKGPLATMIAAAAVAGPTFPGTLLVAGVVEEETPGSRGAVHVRRTWERPDAVVIGEPSGWSNVVLGYKGKLDIGYRVHRAATHPSNPAEKAVEAAAAFWTAATAAAGPQLSHSSFGLPGVTLCELTGDTVDARLEMSYRTPPGFDGEALITRLHELAGDGVVEVRNEVRAVRSSRRDPVVRALCAAIRRAGATPQPKLKTATSDMNTLAEVWDVPIATYGPGDSALDHSEHEHIVIAEFTKATTVLRTALAELVPAAAPGGERQ
ncbi:M20/M25/M40 family metallo-hydrolase [Micromonospora sp. KC723]|uniref:M20/M25/M40 family metallo-hydrolase n=1 Tax=Micromonospora sp. KC723 TaxID=2530381 RepID=UPI00104EDFFA|nr:M20/M25/M40 family metallo-hydrolase [Micromonospora sp. KC723]TDB78273.1 M20/M25/M40 family metallo-hydrolase [Micromonospora sp. KC723]